MTYHQKQLCALMAAALSSTAFAASIPAGIAVPEINEGFVYVPQGPAIHLDYSKLPENTMGAFGLAQAWQDWNAKNPESADSAMFNLKTSDGTKKLNLAYVINESMAKVEGKKGALHIDHDANLEDTELKRMTSGFVTDGAVLGTADDKVSFWLHSAAAFKKEGQSYEGLQNIHNLTFIGEGTTVYGDVINVMARYDSSSIVDGEFNNATIVKLHDGAQWHGDLLTVYAYKNGNPEDNDTFYVEAGKEPRDAFANKVQNRVTLTAGSHWYGATRNVGEAAATNVTINDSAWTVTADSAVTSITTHSHGEITLADGVYLKTGSLSVANSTLAADAEPASGFTIRVDGFNGTALQVADAVAEGTINRVVGTAAVNNGASVEEIADHLLSTVVVEGEVIKSVDFGIEASAFGNAYEGTVSGSGVENVVTYVNPNTDHVADTTAITMMQWRAEATDLMERMGELRGQTGTNGLWTRVTGGRSKFGGIDNDFATLQFGYDHKIEAAEDVYVGGAFSYTEGDTDHATGSGENNLFAVSGYATWIRDNGSYLDLAVRYGMLHNSFELGVADGKFDTQALSVAVEGGHRFALPANTFVEPAIGLSYSHIFAESYDSNTDQGAVRIDQDGIDSTVARAGLRAGMSCPSNKGEVYLSAFYNYDFQAETSTTFGPFRTIEQDFGGGWYELGAGASVNFSDALRGWADFKYVDGGEIETPVRVTVGMRYMF